MTAFDPKGKLDQLLMVRCWRELPDVRIRIKGPGDAVGQIFEWSELRIQVPARLTCNGLSSGL